MFITMKLVVAIFFGLRATLVSATVIRPWEIRALGTTSPPNRQGDGPIPSYAALKIADPTGYSMPSYAEASTCRLDWQYLEQPYGKPFNCTAVEYGVWSVEMVESNNTRSASPTTDFGLHIALAHKDFGLWEAEPWFKVGDNMQGMCSAGGLCAFQLKGELIPLSVKQKKKKKGAEDET